MKVVTKQVTETNVYDVEFVEHKNTNTTRVTYDPDEGFDPSRVHDAIVYTIQTLFKAKRLP